MKTYNLSNLSKTEVAALCRRPAINFDQTLPLVKSVLTAVKNDGDKAVRNFTKRFDNVELDDLKLSSEQISEAAKKVPKEIKTALEQAANNITKFHKVQLEDRKTVETMPGVTCFAEMRPIEKVGLYIPGGTAPLPSTVLMLAIPARLAGCREIVLCTPPSKDGTINDVILAAAEIAEIKTIYKAGGAQAIAAMAYGTETIPKVDKIFGPGNQYVTAAKMLVSTNPEGAAIDMPAGPTELLVVADGAARADFVAADLLSQAEHGTDSQVVLVCTDAQKIDEITTEVKQQLKLLSRQQIAEKALDNSFNVVVKNLDEALDFANQYSPEHLILNVKDPQELVKKVINAGSVFLGAYSPESAGDYASGTNHALPTYGYARTYSGVSVASFQKRITFQQLTPEGVKNIASTVQIIAEQEGLTAHKRAMEIRSE